MEGVDVKSIKELIDETLYGIRRLLRGDKGPVITVSLLNLLYNLVHTGAIPTTNHQRQFFDKHSQLVLDLLDDEISFEWKQAQFIADPTLVRNIAATCPSTAS